MSEIYRNLEEVTEKAIKTGEKVVTIQCPCCSKTFYTLESEAAYQTIIRTEDRFSGKMLGRKCPFCGYSGSLTLANFGDK